jgi:eukaryotic-like serine/threonine-protein kinase
MTHLDALLPVSSPPENDIPPPRDSGIFPCLSGEKDLLGAMVAGLQIEGIIAEGGIGIVYCARSPEGGSSFAIRVLQERHADDLGLVSRFEREIAYASRVDHPNVAKVLRHGHLPDGRPYFVMDLLSGCTLGELVRQKGPLPLERALAISDQILAGLGAMHEARIVHCDLQPDNVFISCDADSADHVMLIDLGFAQEPGADTGDGVSAGSPGSLVGTLPFMAPEQTMRARAITEQSDLFTTALLLYYALSGKLPFRGEDERLVTVAIVRAAPIPLRKERRDIPALLDEILARSLAKHPDARFRGAAEMRAALKEFSGARERWGRRRSA